MPAFLLALLGGLVSIVGSVVGRVLLALGLSYVTYSGFDTGVQWLLTEIKSNMSDLPADVLSFLGWLWVDKAIGLVFSAYSAALVVKGLTSGKLTKLIMKS